MVCFKPLQAFSKDKSDGKKSILWRWQEGTSELTLPCGQCVGCRIDRSTQWAIRCVHEASRWPQNSFVTLTYNPHHLPENGTLVKKDFQDFMKRLRFHFSDRRIRYYMCGEYGDTYGRPHYHALLFNLDFPDKKLFKQSVSGNLYTSDILQRLWSKKHGTDPIGHASIGDVTFQSAAYVSRYIMKKVLGKKSFEHYNIVDPETGEIFSRLPEYTDMSRREGVGKSWIEEYASSVYPRDFVVLLGKNGASKYRPPRYYDLHLERIAPELYEGLKNKRLQRAMEIDARDTRTREKRLYDQEKVLQSKLCKLVRPVD